VGRRQDRVNEFVLKAGSGKASGMAFDLAKIDEVPKFAQSVISSHPDLDCVVLNAGIQYVMDFSKPKTVDISKITHEITVNYIAMVAITHAFMPFFLSKPGEKGLLYTTTSLMSVPYPMVLNYSASKAALHSFIMSVREQLKESNVTGINLVELVTPLVQTELHDGQPGWEPGFNPGMPVKDFVDEALKGFATKEEVVAVGHAKMVYDEFEVERSKRVRPAWEMAKKGLGKAHRFD